MGLMRRLGLKAETRDDGAFDAILFDADGVVQTTDEKWWSTRLTALIGTERPGPGRNASSATSWPRRSPPWPGGPPFAGPLGEVLARSGQVTTPASRGADACGITSTWTPVWWRPSSELRAKAIRCALATNQHPERAAYMRENLGYDEIFDGPLLLLRARGGQA